MSNEHPKPVMCAPPRAVQENTANSYIQSLVDKVSEQVKDNNGKNYSKLTALKFTVQMVNGNNYFVKAKSETGEIVHLRIYKPFEPESEPQLNGIQIDKQLEEPINYF